MAVDVDAIVLAGGLGTRLGARTEQLPKVMIPVGGRPFLTWVLDELARAGVRRVVLALGYRAELVMAGIGHGYAGLDVRYSVEERPLGTGGAVAQAARTATSDEVLVVNGDTFVRLDLEAMTAVHRERAADLTVGVRRVDDVSRFGAVDIVDGHVAGFAEKGRRGAGWVNGGAYLARPEVLAGPGDGAAFSFELAVVGPLVEAGRVTAVELAGPWVDIGVPGDLAAAEVVLALDGNVRP